jgi:(2Fe-2S) ferredoxin
MPFEAWRLCRPPHTDLRTDVPARWGYTIFHPAKSVRDLTNEGPSEDCPGVPHRKRYLFVCTNRRDEGNPKGSCAASGGEELLKLLKADLLKRGLQHEARACGSTCLDLCEFGATVVQEPEHVVYGKVKPEDVADIVEAIATGAVVSRLVVSPPADGT